MKGEGRQLSSLQLGCCTCDRGRRLEAKYIPSIYATVILELKH